MKITIALDATDAAHPRRTGIGIYAEKLTQALARLVASEQDRHVRIVLCFRPGPFVRRAWRAAWPPNCSIAPLLDPWLPFPSATLFHGLSQRLPEHRYRAQVVTLHERFPPLSQDYSTPEFQRHMGARIEQALRRADRVIAVSESVRQRLLQHDSALAAKARVIHHGVDPPQPVTEQETALFCRRVLGSSDRFFLNVGAIQVRKNLTNLVLALKQVPGFRLVVAGSDGYGSDAIREFIRMEGLGERVVFTGHLQPDQLRLLYAAATALVFPSFEEAFGMPILEAMSYGLPVITSNCSAMPEVGGDAALYVDPHDVAQIAEAMRRVSEDDRLAQQLREKGRERVRMFRWEDCAARTWKLYRELLP
jgi:glycosyltransferase involved in cell wall biosynthesis